MKRRIEYAKIAPEVPRAMGGLDAYVKRGSLEASLVELVKVRTSQINGRAFCIDMHTKDARAKGESEQRLYALDAWRATLFFSERTALAWTEAVTNVSEGHVPDGVYESALQRFTERELVDLTIAIVAINGWNRLAVNMRSVPGTYRTARAESVTRDRERAGNVLQIGTRLD